jgi:hypothetical protein
VVQIAPFLELIKRRKKERILKTKLRKKLYHVQESRRMLYLSYQGLCKIYC